MRLEVPNTEKVKVSVNCRNTAGSAPEKIMKRQDYDHKTVSTLLFTNCGPWTRSICINGELARNVEFQALPSYTEPESAFFNKILR